jgi:hypothetical protein
LMRRLRIKEIMLPPNYSQLLQPLDHSLNALIKYVYRLEHARWLLRDLTKPTAPAAAADAAAAVAPARGRKRKREVVADSRTRAPTREEVEIRIATAVYALRTSHIVKCWQHTLNGRGLLETAIIGHAQHVEKNGWPAEIPLSRKRKSKAAAAAMVERSSQSSGVADDEAADEAAAMGAAGDDLQIVPLEEDSDNENE